MNDEIKAVIVDDEQEAIDYLSVLLQENFPEINIVATANSSGDALEKIFRKNPDLLFLDIKIDNKTGFDILLEIEKENHFPYIVFVTAYNIFAVDAFKANALDYLLKPVDAEDLRNAVSKFFTQKQKDLQFENLQNLLVQQNKKIRFNTRTGFVLINPDQIVFCEADGNYSEIQLINQSKVVVCLNLKNLMKELPAKHFKRISRSHIINEEFLSEVDRSQQKCILSVNGSNFQLSYSPLRMTGLF